MKTQTSILRESGFTITEVLIATAACFALTLATSAMVLKLHKQTKTGASEQEVLEFVSSIRTKLAEFQSVKSVRNNCSATLSLNNSSSTSFNPAASARNDVKISMDGVDFLAGSKSPNGKVTIRSLYLSGTTLIGTSQGNRKNYLSTLMVVTEPGDFLRRPRDVLSLSLEVDSMTNSITQCFVASSSLSSQSACDESFGLRWNTKTSRCDQDVGDSSASAVFECPAGFKGTAPNCVPIPTTCASGQIATNYKLGQVRDCQSPPTRLAGISPRVAEPLSRPANDPSLPPTPAPVTTQAQFQAATPKRTVQSHGSSRAPANCADGSAVSLLSADPCTGSSSLSGVSYLENSCLWPTTPAVASSCETRNSSDYATPDLSSHSPDLSAPADNSCQCNNRRIATGEYCMYCIKDPNLGYGYAKLSFGVSRCANGNLVEIPNAAILRPTRICNNNYGRAASQGGLFYQFEEVP